MSRRTLMLASVSPLALLAAIPTPEPSGWYGAGADDLWPVGSWLSAALDDPKVCAEMKRDINEWFDGGGHLRALASPVSGDGSSADADTHRGADGSVLADKTFVLSAGLSKKEGGQLFTSIMQGLRRCASLDEATGSFIATIRAERPGFSIDEILSMEIEGLPPPAASRSPGMETLKASECTKHGEES